MKKLTAAAFTCLLAMTACRVNPVEAERQSLMDASKQELADAVSERDELLALVHEIYSGMEEIKQLESAMSVASPAKGENSPGRARILADIKAIRHRIEERKHALEELEERMRASDLYTEELQATIDMFRTQISVQSKEIARLQQQLSTAREEIGTLNYAVDSLNATVADVSRQLDDANCTSASLEQELNTCHYVVAPKKELREHKILETAFLRKSKLMEGEFDRSFFVTADRRSLDAIEIPSRKVKIHTKHPVGSYEITENPTSKTLRIIAPDKFWSLTNYLVVESD